MAIYQQCLQLFGSVNMSITPQHSGTLEWPFIYSTCFCKVVARAGYGMTAGIFFFYWMTKEKDRQTESLLKRQQIKLTLLGTKQAPRNWILACKLDPESLQCY